MDIYRTPLLTAREVARHLKMPESTLDVWIASQADDAPLIHAVQPERRGWPRMPFISIIETYVLRSLRELGAPKADVLRAAEIIRHEFGDEYALASKRIATDGIALFVELADKSILHVRDNQYGIREVLDGYLQYITWDDDGKPRNLRLRQYPDQAQVVIDPRFGWGAPVLANSRVPVEAMLDLWRTGEPMSIVSEEFDLPLTVVEDVLRVAAA
ncbi:MAG TPA: DUF433 domain-containing protein [Nocardioides sp.]|nr:DUF433 domain-containing protein [Nocardioides sp.]